ncbi:DNA adenine methylase [Desulfitobacterium chlororespirans]|uniref:Site-specific DNA-methyltransferase (adenine-specific) n=1 Tax=Desulfitobacterium chlororespirans DSM 11544 TaxID=1121395 RepID=A0A1M7UX81_9FIRM|nr:DNA adenine methylase [Desulfitobacterium chlororespirans]SHN87578.1 DNA adenine methylase [Desulfitobacterium chlororespirans DSM 11544]
MHKDRLVAPVVKWVGGKRQLLEDLTPLFPKRVESYCEPFFGGGAVLFKLQPDTAWVNDVNSELIQMYEVIRDDVEELIRALGEHPNEEEHFYRVRDWDRDKEKYGNLSKVQKAARVIYLNKTCYNGLFRVNNAGEFNTPFGHYKNPNIVNEHTLRAVSTYFRRAQITFSSTDYAEVLAGVAKGTFVYLDPPYDPVSSTANFTGYAKGGFDRAEQIRLRECCDELDRRGIKFMLSNSATEFIKEQYGAYQITIVKAKRAINSNATKRGQIDEVVVRNYK